jgi:hexosaminidase
MTQTNAVPAIIPRPVHMEVHLGRFVLKPDTHIAVSRETRVLGDRLAADLRPATNLALDVNAHGGHNAISLRIDPKLADLGPEGYRLNATTDGVEIKASGPAGVFYGIQTLRQLLPVENYRRAKYSDVDWSIPCVSIEDKPRFAWRGALVDVSRHFMPKEALLKFIDTLAMHKMNSFHMHLTDDQGWRMQIKKYPKLTEVGAWHKPSALTNDPTTVPNVPDGGFYTQDDLREIVAYARDRFINVVPEIEMPGHSNAAIVSYPELGSNGKAKEVPPVNGYAPDVLNVDDGTIKFYQDVLTEVMDVFPSKFIHIGGDEVDKGPWKGNANAQDRIKKLGLKNEDELQSWFIRQMDSFLTQHGRRMIGWDEILEGGLAQNATVMSWRGIAGGIAAAKAGHDVVMAPTGNTYLDYYQSSDHATEPRAIGGLLPLEKVYAYDPIPSELTPQESKHVLGAQGQLWTEYIPNPKHLEYMAWPRLCALAEVTWSPAEGKSFADFINRLKPHLERLKVLDVTYRPLDKAAAPPAAMWKSGEMSETYAAHTWDVSSLVKAAGPYKATFSYLDGACRLDIGWVELLQGESVVFRDEHFGRTGGDDLDNVYRLNLPSFRPGKYTLRANVRTDGGTDSTGEIRFVSGA